MVSSCLESWRWVQTAYILRYDGIYLFIWLALYHLCRLEHTDELSNLCAAVCAVLQICCSDAFWSCQVLGGAWPAMRWMVMSQQNVDSLTRSEGWSSRCGRSEPSELLHHRSRLEHRESALAWGTPELLHICWRRDYLWWWVWGQEQGRHSERQWCWCTGSLQDCEGSAWQGSGPWWNRWLNLQDERATSALQCPLQDRRRNTWHTTWAVWSKQSNHF